jgi:hypothetical protein
MSEAITTERMSIDVPEVRVREQGAGTARNDQWVSVYARAISRCALFG